MKKIRDCPFVIVEWLDSASINAGEWHYPDKSDLPTGVSKCVTAGWTVRETDDALVVASSFVAFEGEEEETDFGFCHIMQIPKRAIIREYQAQDAAAALWPKDEAPEHENPILVDHETGLDT